ncbi:MAG: Flp pilus assembly complex ATPase component TadA [Kangiellaceae bacterium]|nr:Flp pilus assembly complex ATPase component TadA [Kangiellaceae bacterium]
MFEVKVRTQKGTEVAHLRCTSDNCGLGKSKSNLVVLHGIKIAQEHAVLKLVENGIFIRDISNSRTGVAVNGKKIEESGPLTEDDTVQIGGYIIQITPPKSQQHKISESTDVNLDIVETKPQDNEITEVLPQKKPVNKLDGKPSKDIVERNNWRKKVHQALLKQIDLRRIKVNEMSDDVLREKSRELILQVMEKINDLPKHIDHVELANEVLDETVGLGPLEKLLSDKDISEIMVNSHDQIFYEKAGKLFLSDVAFTDDHAVIGAIERIVTPLGRRIDESSPMVDARLKDGSRVNAIIPPLALKGPSITIRKFMSNKLTAEDLVGFGAMNYEMMEFLKNAVLYKKNMVVSGGTGSGKTTLLNVLSNYIPDDERIVTVEDSAELKLTQPNLVSLEARPPNQEGKGAVEIRDLVKNCLRMRPDRVVVGECRGGEALDMLQAMNTGHDGSLTTAHANRPRDCISRLEVMVMMSGMDLPVLAIREQIASAVDIIIQQTRFSDGSRRITSIAELTGIESGTVQLAEIFRFTRSGINREGKILGHFEATGLIPEFYEELSRNGIEVNLGIFSKRDVI